MHTLAVLNELKPLVWDSQPTTTLFWQTVLEREGQHVGISIFWEFMQLLKFERSPGALPGPPVDPSTFYHGLLEEKSLPTGMMMAKSAEHCFLVNSPAFIKNVGGKFVVDLTQYHFYEVECDAEGRNKNPKYGGKAELSAPSAGAPAKIISIVAGKGDGDVLVSGDADYATALNVFLSTFALHLVVVKHATVTHLAVYQRLLVKYSNASFQPLAEANPRIEFLLQVLFTGTNSVSINEQLLIGGHKSLVGRACSLAKGELLNACQHEYNRVSAMPAKAIFDEEFADGSPTWQSAANEAWTASAALVGKMLSGLDHGDLDIDELTLLVFVGSYYHTFIGDFQANNVMRGLLPFPCTGEPPVQDEHNATLSGTIAVTTLTRAYDLNDVITFADDGLLAAEKFSGEDKTVTKAAFTTLIAALGAIEDTGIDQFHPTQVGLEGELKSYPSVNF